MGVPALVGAALLFHPPVERGFFELPAIAYLEGRNLFLKRVLVKRISTHAQVSGSLATIHYLRRIGHDASSQRFFVPQSREIHPRLTTGRNVHGFMAIGNQLQSMCHEYRFSIATYGRLPVSVCMVLHFDGCFLPYQPVQPRDKLSTW